MEFESKGAAGTMVCKHSEAALASERLEVDPRESTVRTRITVAHKSANLRPKTRHTTATPQPYTTRHFKM